MGMNLVMRCFGGGSSVQRGKRYGDVRVELVGDFANVVATMNMEDILHDGGQGP
jgi:hypothetical protein